MTTIEARQRIADLLKLRDQITLRIQQDYELNHARVDRHIEIIKNMAGGHWDNSVADNYIKILESRTVQNQT